MAAARRYSESSSDSWSLVERRSSVESSDEDECEIVARDVYDDTYDNESIGNDSMEDDTDFTDSELNDDEANKDENEEQLSEEEEEEDGEVETIHEEEALADSAARHFVAAEKVVERLDELADSCDSPMEEALFSAVATPERLRLFVLLWLSITGVFVFGLERAFATHMNLITPTQSTNSEMMQAGLPSREHLSRIGVAEVRDFLNRRQLLRAPPRFELQGSYKKAYLKREGARKQEERECKGGYANTTISIRSPSTSWSQCTAADAPVVMPKPLASQLVHLPVYSPNKTRRAHFKTPLTAPRFATTSISRSNINSVQPLRPIQLQQPCIPSASRPCSPNGQLRPTRPPRSLRPSQALSMKPTTMKTRAKLTAPSVYRNYSVMRVYHDRSVRRNPKLCILPSTSLLSKKKVEKKKAVDQKKLVDRMNKRRKQQNAAAKKFNKRSAPPPVIYANASAAAANSKALMRKSSFAAGHCDRRVVKELRPLPCISYKEQLPCLAPPPRRLLTATNTKKKPTLATKIGVNASKKARSNPKKEYIRRIPLV
ncbi:hypothetical protein PMAYCL1PPCAC_21842 [Pristionchus mayeri]|uniref:Uncharacterized protein n=1 Tax=Pristionchus mayeri TaxID=1317129 RepID=A0AAN5CW36_9BILA|nr:hypothetical protein PMAYCL1PPCAC_21842 [Pristionchus mayeri]